MNRRVGSVVLAGLLALTACGSGGRAQPAGTSGSSEQISPPLDVCSATKVAWREVPAPVDAAAVGSGPAVIFANDSGNSVCGWQALAGQLVSAGHRVAVFSYANPSARSDPDNLRALLAVATAVANGRRYVLIGASIGGRLVIEAAAGAPAGLAGVVSLSGEATLPEAQDITPLARRVRLPVLYVGARQDGYTDGTKQQDALHAALRGHPNLLLQRPGRAHGTTLLTGADGAVVRPRVVAFVNRLLR